MKKTIFLISIFFLSVLFAQGTGAKYLIITNDNFYGAVQPLAEWKHKKGMCTKIAKLSEIGSSATQIRTYIANAYNTWQVKPQFVLLVGAPNYLPFPMVNGIFSDNYYTNMDGDIYNEILSGRLTVHNTTEAQTVVNKILMYERTPYLVDSMWFRKACLIVNDYPQGYPDEDSITYRLDAEYVANHMVNDGYVRVDTFFARHGDNVTSVINATNNGRAFVLYRGRGSNNWYSPFNVVADNLANGNMLPITISATCNTLGTGSTPAAAERWFLTGSPTTLRGASGYFATTTSDVNIAYLRSAVTRGFFDGVFLRDFRTFGEACESGRLRVDSMYPYTGGVAEYYGFTTVGDPEMNIWTSTPQLMTVTHDTLFNAGINETLHVSVGRSGMPVESAYVCIVCDTFLYQTGYTGSDGTISFGFNIPSENIIEITITGRNLYPYEGTATAIGSGAFVSYLNNTVEDSLGNNNSIVDPGETIILWAALKNFGVALANDVIAVLTSNDSMVAISDSLSIYGDLAPGMSSSGLNPFVFSVSPQIIAHPILFDMAITDSAGDFWINSFWVLTTGVDNSGNSTGPDQYGYYLYDDTDTLTGNAPSYSWFEIAPPMGGPGIIIPEVTNSDADTVTLPLPFGFKFYGTDYNTVGVCSNGFIEIGGANYPYSYNDPIPTLGRARNYAAPYWDDLDPSTQTYGHGDIYQYYDSANHRWIVEFYQVAIGYDPYAWQTFQVILHDPNYYPTPTSDGEILYMYQNISYATSNTVGIEDMSETCGLQYVYNNNYDPNAVPLVNGRALLITTKPPLPQHSPWLYLVNYTIRDSAGGNNNGIPEPNEALEIVLDIRNAGDTSVVGVSGQLSSGSGSAVVVDGNADFGDLDVGGTANNAADPYDVQIAVDPVDTVVGMVVHFVGNLGDYESYAYFTLRIHDETAVFEGTGDVRQGTGLVVYPNPFLKQVNIRCIVHDAGSMMGEADQNIRGSAGSIRHPPSIVADARLTGYQQPALKIYDATGRLVKSFALSPMPYALSIVWHGDDDAGRKLPAGVYFIKLENQDTKVIDKVIMLR